MVVVDDDWKGSKTALFATMEEKNPFFGVETAVVVGTDWAGETTALVDTEEEEGGKDGCWVDLPLSC